jgi:hypothetical protein
MKKIVTYAILAINFVLVWFVIDILGFWPIISIFLITTTATIVFNKVGSRSESEGVITYNPKEWPKFVLILIGACVGYYLYSLLGELKIDEGQASTVWAYITLNSILPVLISIYTLIRDRNDYITITSTHVAYKDNSKAEEINFEDIASVSIEAGIKLNLKNNSYVLIQTPKMNFTVKDIVGVVADINAKITK